MTRRRIVIEGVVQGVGFRPFIKTVAERFGLPGIAFNTASGVVVEIDAADPAEAGRFAETLRAQAPVAARVEQMLMEEIAPCQPPFTEFVIAPSALRDHAFTLTSPDLATCAQCAAEIRDPADRRYGYPFNNCTNCGPRYSITVSTPYDRATTTMAPFVMCGDCAAEYGDFSNRRFHAEPVACPVCGPRLSFPIDEAIAALEAGEIVALKGLGGFQLACDALSDAAVNRLRERKRRSRKPFAIMMRDLDAVERCFVVGDAERRLLTSAAAPIVLLTARDTAALSGVNPAPAVSPGLARFGVMLPYTPLHHLLFGGRLSGGKLDALVMTSGNRSEEPIVVTNDDAATRLAPIADRVLTHNRDIFMRVDDSVTRVFEGVPRILRRARGYAPGAIRLAGEVPEVLAVGAQLKNTFCITKGRYAIPSQHIGDLENYETLEFFDETWGNLRSVYQAQPRLIVHDLHPDYLSTRWALAFRAPTLAVQHHHAHIAACMAENGVSGKVIGVAFDGTGLGTDGQIWGGEFLICDYRGFERAAHLRYVALPGGDRAARETRRMSAAHLYDALGADSLEADMSRWRKMLERPAMLTSSCGRLFDAVAALCGASAENGYEGEAAILLESLAERGRSALPYPIPVDRETTPWTIDTRLMIRAIVTDVSKGRASCDIARCFHDSLAHMIGAVCTELREIAGIDTVCLSGGTFQNWTLLAATNELLRRRGFTVHLHARVPPNDGGLSLGQAAIGAAYLESLEGGASDVPGDSRQN